MITSERNERVIHLKLNNPPVNVIDTATCKELTDKLAEAASDETVAALLLSGEGKCFSAGASVDEHEEEFAKEMLASLRECCKTLSNLPFPSVALVHGACLGGGLELSMCCDFIVADPGAKFGLPEIKLAFFPPFACSALPDIVGRQNAAHLILTGESIDAARAHEIGLVQEIVERSEWAGIEKRFNRTSSPALRLAKRGIKLGIATSEDESLGALEALFIERIYEIEDVSEGIACFREKRKPEWKHR